MHAITSTKGLDYVCCTCGIALYKHEIDAECTGTYIDYTEHQWGELELRFCSECWGKIKEIINRDHGDAIMRRKELEAGSNKRERTQLDFDDAVDQFIEDNPFGHKAPDGVGEGI